MDGETPEQRERRLIAEAEQRAREDAEILGRLKAHDEQFKRQDEWTRQATAERAALKQQLADLAAAFSRSLTVAETRAEDAKKAAAKQVTTRELYLAAAGVTVTLIGVLAAGGVFG